MLFLAVFCGFLAEYKLEHIIEHQREEQYMKSMTEDLKSDINMLENNIALRKMRITMVDSLINLLNSPTRDNSGNDLYFLGRRISQPINIFPNDRTIQQLKSSGTLRLIRKKEISNSIMAYDQNIRNALFEMGDEVLLRGEYRQLAVKVFNTTIFNDILTTDGIARPLNNPKLFSTNAAFYKRTNRCSTIY